MYVHVSLWRLYFVCVRTFQMNVGMSFTVRLYSWPLTWKQQDRRMSVSRRRLVLISCKLRVTYGNKRSPWGVRIIIEVVNFFLVVTPKANYNMYVCKWKGKCNEELKWFRIITMYVRTYLKDSAMTYDLFMGSLFNIHIRCNFLIGTTFL